MKILHLSGDPNPFAPHFTLANIKPVPIKYTAKHLFLRNYINGNLHH